MSELHANPEAGKTFKGLLQFISARATKPSALAPGVPSTSAEGKTPIIGADLSPIPRRSLPGLESESENVNENPITFLNGMYCNRQIKSSQTN